MKSCELSPSSTRAQQSKPETGTPERTLQRQVERFEEHGMISPFPKEPIHPSNDARELPPDMRQLIIDLKAEYPDFRPHEIATICYARFGRSPSHHTVQRVLASGPQPSITARRFPSYSEIADGYERRCIVVRLHAEGWSVSTISTCFWKCAGKELPEGHSRVSKTVRLLRILSPPQNE